jgi:AraC-like DNA-binding protein
MESPSMQDLPPRGRRRHDPADRGGALSGNGCAPPLLLAWGARALYLGPPFVLTAHRNAVAVLAVGLDRPLAWAIDPLDAAAGASRCRAALIEPGTLHRLLPGAGECAFLYLDASDADLSVLRARCRMPQGRAPAALRDPAALCAALRALPRHAPGWATPADTLAPLERALALPRRPSDARVARLLRELAGQPADPRDLRGWGMALGLSAGRLRHLVKAVTGVPFGRLRLWLRLRAAILLAVRDDGDGLTGAAWDAGLAGSAHLSAAFRAMFGLAPSQLLARGPLVVVADGGAAVAPAPARGPTEAVAAAPAPPARPQTVEVAAAPATPARRPRAPARAAPART